MCVRARTRVHSVYAWGRCVYVSVGLHLWWVSCVGSGSPCPFLPSLADSYSKDYDPEDWLQVDGATGWVQTQHVLSPASPFLKDGWYRAIILAYDDGKHQVHTWAPKLPSPGWVPPLLPKG